MGFKENLQKKIEINQLATQVIRSFNQPNSSGRFDKPAMQKLLTMGAYPMQHERDMDLYLLSSAQDERHKGDKTQPKILVLDNGLGIYQTSIEDVCLRKSPTVKEMISIRNAIKILNDKDVVLSKKADSVQSVQTDILNGLDLAYTNEDLDGIEKEGRASLENQYADGVVEALTLFAELLEYRDPPKPFQVPHHVIRARLLNDTTGKTTIGPIVIYDKTHNELKLIESSGETSNKEKADQFRQIVAGNTDADKEGGVVFSALKALVPPYRP